MGRKVTVTAEQVNAAADVMKAEGNRPTSRTIRERLGEDAFMGTINRLLQRWKGVQERPRAPTSACRRRCRRRSSAIWKRN